MRCLTPIAIVALVALLGVSGYNLWQIREMKKEISSIKVGVYNSGSQDLIAALASAKKHAVNARELMAKGKTKSAQAEIDESLKSLERAAAISRTIEADDKKIDLGPAISTIQREFEGLMKEVSKQMPAGRQKNNEEPNNK